MMRLGDFRRVLAHLAVLALPLMLTSGTALATMSDYCATPPFMSNSVPPNVLIVLDNSGSMNGQAYAGSYDPSQFVSGHYYGYFNPTANYKYNGSRWEETVDDFATATAANPIASGNFLNWATTRRIDAAKKLLIGGKANPRSASAGQTVKLIGEDADSPVRDFTKDFDNSALPELIAPFSGNYRYKMAGNELSITPLVSGSSSYRAYPNGNFSVPAAWSASGAGAAWQAVDEASEDGDSTTVENRSSTAPALFDYNYADSKTGTIASVTVKVVARKNKKGTMRLQGVLRLGGVNYAATWENLDTDYETYNFTFATNPATGQPWQWSQIKTAGAGTLLAFGVQADTTPSTSVYPIVTQVYLHISTSTPSGGPYTTIVDQGGEAARGLIDSLSNNARFGLAFYNRGNGIETGIRNGRYDGGHVENYINFGAPNDMVLSIQNLTADTWTPLAETLYEMVRYFRQQPPYYYGNSPANYQTGTSYDPFYFQYSKWAGSNLPDQYVKCAKSFILMLTDGESTMDRNIPPSLQDFDEDGRDRTIGSDSATDYLDDVALWARTTDHRSTAQGTHDLPGMQNIVLYSVYMFGRGSQVLKDAAVNGGFDDLNGDNAPGPLLAEYRRDSDGDGAITAADLPLTYFEGDDGYELEKSIIEAIAGILKRAASGTAVSVLTTSARGVGSMVQAYFLPVRQEGSREVSWTGYTQNLWIDPQNNLREDTVNDYLLKPNAITAGGDRVLKLYFDTVTTETKAALFTTDQNGENGSLASCTPTEKKPFGQVTYLWEAGKKLALKPAADRDIFTSKKVISSSGTTTITDNIFSNPLNPSLVPALDADATYSAGDIVRYVRGEDLESSNASFRDRRITVDGTLKVWKLGDIINSTPKVFAGTPQNAYHTDYSDLTYYRYFRGAQYRDRSSIAFGGANDGMLHAFRVGYLKDTDLPADTKGMLQDNAGSTGTAGLGEEVWGYIPYNAFPYLKYLANPDYCHIYFNDLSVRLFDASINGGPTELKTGPTYSGSTVSDPGSWKSLLIGGMRFGGACGSGSPSPPMAGVDVGFSAYYAIDITNPEAPVPLWEFSDSDLGYATVFPSVVRTGLTNQNGNWYVVLGSGSTTLPKGTTDIGRSTPGYIFILDLRTGALVKKINLGHNAIVGDLLAIDAEKDYRSEKIYFGTSYKSGTAWAGKLMSLEIPEDVNGLCGSGVSRSYADCTPTSKPPLRVLFNGAYPFTASPDATLDEYANIWAYIGSGKYYSDLDETDTAQQIFLGLKDIDGITYPLAIADLNDQTTAFNSTTGTATETAQVCAYDPSAIGEFAFKNVATAVDWNTACSDSPPGKGWRLMLNNGERVMTRPLALGGLVDFLTYKPSADPCSFGGETYLYAVNYVSGCVPPDIAIPTSNPTPKVLLGPGAPPTGEAIIIPPPKDNDPNPKKKIQVSTGVVIETENKPTFKVTPDVLHWLKK